MKQYIEGIKCSFWSSFSAEKVASDFVRIALDDFAGTDEELIDYVKTLFSGCYMIKRHYCRHDEEKPCTAETVFDSAV